MLPRIFTLLGILLVGTTAFGQDPIVSAISPDGRLLAISKDRTINLIDIQTQKELLSLRGHTAAVSAVGFAPDGKFLATGGKDKAVLLWDIGTGRQLRKFSVGATVDQVRFSQDGARLLTRETDKTQREFEVASGKELKVQKP